MRFEKLTFRTCEVVVGRVFVVLEFGKRLVAGLILLPARLAVAVEITLRLGIVVAAPDQSRESEDSDYRERATFLTAFYGLGRLMDPRAVMVKVPVGGPSQSPWKRATTR